MLYESLICHEENNVRAGYLAKPLTARLGSGAKNSDMPIGVAGAAAAKRKPAVCSHPGQFIWHVPYSLRASR